MEGSEINEKDKKCLKYGWNNFIKYAEENGISLEYEDDWKEWWDCWKAGYEDCLKSVNLIIK